jgi:hypothetical protein
MIAGRRIDQRFGRILPAGGIEIHRRGCPTPFSPLSRNHAALSRDLAGYKEQQYQHFAGSQRAIIQFHMSSVNQYII